MPKFTVYIHETDVFRLDVEAADEQAAGDIALQIQGDRCMSADSYHRELSEIVPLPDDAPIDFDEISLK
jgi:hypothetical protein